jgi:hypothetical protein
LPFGSNLEFRNSLTLPQQHLIQSQRQRSIEWTTVVTKLATESKKSVRMADAADKRFVGLAADHFKDITKFLTRVEVRMLPLAPNSKPLTTSDFFSWQMSSTLKPRLS